MTFHGLHSVTVVIVQLMSNQASWQSKTQHNTAKSKELYVVM